MLRVYKHVYVFVMILIPIFCFCFAIPVSAEDFVIIVNKANQIESVTKAEVSRIFQKKIFNWENGLEIKPVDLPSDSNVREHFTEKIRAL